MFGLLAATGKSVGAKFGLHCPLKTIVGKLDHQVAFAASISLWCAIFEQIKTIRLFGNSLGNIVKGIFQLLGIARKNTGRFSNFRKDFGIDFRTESYCKK